MKTRGILLAIAVMAGMLTAVGCSDMTSEVSQINKKLDKAVEDSVSEETETSENDEETEAEETSEKSALQQAREEARDEADANADSEEQEDEEVSADSDIQAAAEELYQKSCDTFWGTLINCTYQLDESDQSGEGVRVADFNSLDELKDKYMEVFAEPDPTIDEKYFEENGKLYCRDGARGANIYYKSTELVPVKVTDFMAEYTAVSYYSDPETNEPMDKQSYSFKMMNTADGWRTAEFTLPY